MCVSPLRTDRNGSCRRPSLVHRTGLAVTTIGRPVIMRWSNLQLSRARAHELCGQRGMAGLCTAGRPGLREHQLPATDLAAAWTQAMGAQLAHRRSVWKSVNSAELPSAFLLPQKASQPALHAIPMIRPPPS